MFGCRPRLRRRFDRRHDPRRRLPSSLESQKQKQNHRHTRRLPETPSTRNALGLTLDLTSDAGAAGAALASSDSTAIPVPHLRVQLKKRICKVLQLSGSEKQLNDASSLDRYEPPLEGEPSAPGGTLPGLFQNFQASSALASRNSFTTGNIFLLTGSRPHVRRREASVGD